MKNTTYIILFLLSAFCQSAFGQRIGDLNGIYYQAVAIDEYGKEIVGMDVEGKPLYNKAIGVRFTITKGLNGAIQWEETHTTNTDRYGLFSLVIGKGNRTPNSAYAKLLDIPWIDADQFLKVEISSRNDSVYRLVSNQQFMSVPYAFYSDDIADDAITTEKVRDLEIRNQDIANETIDLTAKVTKVLPVKNGGTGRAVLPVNSLIVGQGTADVRPIGAATNGQIPIGVTDDAPVLANIKAGKGIIVTGIHRDLSRWFGLRHAQHRDHQQPAGIHLGADHCPGCFVGQHHRSRPGYRPQRLHHQRLRDRTQSDPREYFQCLRTRRLPGQPGPQNLGGAIKF